jgi:hypothetical protein
VAFWPTVGRTIRKYSFFRSSAAYDALGQPSWRRIASALYSGYTATGKSFWSFVLFFFLEQFIFPAFSPALTLDT